MGKDGIYKECLARFGKERLEIMETIFTPAKSAEEFKLKLRLWIENLINCHIVEPEISTIIHRECVYDLPHIKDVFKDSYLKAFFKLVDFFNHAKKSGIFSKELDSELTANMLFGAIMHIAQTDNLRKEVTQKSIFDEKFRKSVVENAMHLVLNGVIR